MFVGASFALRFARKVKFGQMDFRRCAPGSSHSSLLKGRAVAESQMWLWLEFRAYLNVIKHDENAAFAHGVSVANRKCGCG